MSDGSDLGPQAVQPLDEDKVSVPLVFDAKRTKLDQFGLVTSCRLDVNLNDYWGVKRQTRV